MTNREEQRKGRETAVNARTGKPPSRETNKPHSGKRRWQSQD